MSEVVTLIAKVRNGDREAFNELYGIYYNSMLSYAGLFVDDAMAEDIVQELFLKIWINRSNLLDSNSLYKYLMRSVYHASLNAIKKRRSDSAYRSWYAQQIEDMSYVHYDPDKSDIIRNLYSQELAAEIDQAIDALPEKCRQVFKMSHIEGLSNREISTQLGITLSTVENHIYIAMKQLRLKLGAHKMLIFLAFYIFNR